MKWYAVQKTPEDAWDYGSHDYGEAVKMLREQGEGLIAVINEDTKVCEKEIRLDEIAEYEDAFDGLIVLHEMLYDNGTMDKIMALPEELFLSLIGTLTDSYGMAHGLSNEHVQGMMELLLETMKAVHNDLPMEGGGKE